MVEDYDQHQQIAVSLADDLVGEARPSAPQHKSPSPAVAAIARYRAADDLFDRLGDQLNGTLEDDAFERSMAAGR